MSQPIISVAAVDADPLDPDAWTALGHLADGQLTTVDDAPEYDYAKMKDTLKEFTASFEVSRPSPAMLAPLFHGIPVIEAPAMPDGLSMFLAAERMALFLPRFDMRPFTDLERDGEWAKRTVRRGLTEAFPWLDMDPGPDPDAAYTDHLMKVSILPRLAVNPA